MRRRLGAITRRRAVRRTFFIGGAVIGAVVIASGLLLWRLNSGPIELDLATPWLTAAIEENFGHSHSVSVGGTQLERDETGRPALRIRDIVVRDADGTIVASAPKAEVGLSASSLLSGRVRAESLNLVGAEMAVRIEADGKITVFAGGDRQRPIVTAPAATAAPAIPPRPQPSPNAGITAPAPPLPAPSTGPAAPARSGFEDVAALLAWIDGLGVSGLDGYELDELGLKNGNLTVDDRRSNKRWNFTSINLSLTRPKPGGVILRINSENQQRPWQLSAAMAPMSGGLRAVGIEARKVSSKDLQLALRIGEDEVESDLLLSASVRGEITLDGTPQFVEGQLLAEAGFIRDAEDPVTRLDIDRAEFGLNWDAQRRALIVPFQILSGGNRVTLLAKMEASRDQSGVWSFEINRGPVIDPFILTSSGQPDDEPLILNRASLRARIDLNKRRIDVEQGDIGRNDPRPMHNVGLGFSGQLDYSGAEPRLAFGIAGTKMSVTAFKRMWPTFIAANVRSWVEDHLSGGTVERILVAANAPLPTFRASGPPLPDEGLSIDVETSGTSIRPVDTLPAIRDADLNIRVTGRTANVSLGRGTIEVSPGRKLNVASGVFEVPDTAPKDPPARARFRVDGSMPAAAELLSMDALRDVSGVPIDPATSRGTLTAQVTLSLPLATELPKGAVNYTIASDITNFAAEKMLFGQKVEAAALRVTANAQLYQVRGDVKVNGVAAALDYRKVGGEAEGELRLQATLDETARTRFGFDLGSGVTGSLPVKLSGRVGPAEKETRFNVDVDLGPAKIDNLLPGWVKPAGKSARAVFTMYKDKNVTRFDDITIEGQGTLAKGSVEVDGAGEVLSANFPVFAISDGDKLTLKAERISDGALRVIMRGDTYDGRNFVKSSMAGPPPDQRAKRRLSDLDIDVRIGAVAGHHGEALRSLELRLSRRAGRIRSFNMNAKIGRDTPLIGDMRTRTSNGRQVLYFENNDAGAFFRFADVYPRIQGGKMWIAMDPPTQDLAPQEWLMNVRDFAVRGEPALERVVAGAPGGQQTAIEFSQASVSFTRTAGRMVIRDGVVRGPLVGATIEGMIDYGRDEVHMRGTFVPLYGLNNMFGQIPIVGFFLGGGPNEGLLGITYEVTGPPGNPRVTPNPISAITPGALRKVFELRDITGERPYVEPPRQ